MYLAGIRSKNYYVTGDKMPRITIKLHVLITRISNTNESCNIAFEFNFFYYNGMVGFFYTDMYIDETYVWYWVSEMNLKFGGGGGSV